MYNDYWMRDQGFLERESHHDLRDLIARRHADFATVTLGEGDTLLAAYSKMKLYDVSQIPVLDGAGGVIGIVDESDVLLSVYRNEDGFNEPVAAAMTRRLETVDADRPLEDLMPIFQRDHVPIVMAEGKFLGLITRIDFLNHLRRRMRS
jgi:cystathionine beta-synthase